MGAPKGTKPWNVGKGKGWVDPRGYRIICKTVNGRRYQIREHRQIMENHLGRKLEPWEIVHHLDGNQLNNDISNLTVMEHGKHTAEHHQGSKQAYESKRSMEAFANMRWELVRTRKTNADLLQALEAIMADYDAWQKGDIENPIAIVNEEKAIAAIARARGQ